jgi:hypothetical protein
MKILKGIFMNWYASSRSARGRRNKTSAGTVYFVVESAAKVQWNFRVAGTK